MGIEFKSNINVTQLQQDLRKQQQIALEKAMSDAATEIVVRTRGQKDANGSGLKPLSLKYKKFKVLKGRQGVPDRTFTGAMLAAITSRVEQVGSNLVGYIFFSSAKEGTKAHGLQKLGEFFKLSQQQITKIISKLQGS